MRDPEGPGEDTKKKGKKEKKHQTSTRVFKRLYFYYSYPRKLQSVKSFSTFQKITISKAVLYISENYNWQTPIQGENPKKDKKKKKEKEKRGEERHSIRNGP